MKDCTFTETLFGNISSDESLSIQLFLLLSHQDIVVDPSTSLSLFAEARKQIFDQSYKI